MNTTTVTIDGTRVELAFGATYRVRFRRDRILDPVVLARRERNGDLVFDRGERADERLRWNRIRTRDLVSIFPVEAPEPVADLAGELAKRSVIAPRKDGETARDYLRRLERGLGNGQYARWIETELGQAALAAAAAEDQAARRLAAKERKDPKLEVGDAVVVDGTKHRVRGLVAGELAELAVAGPNWKRTPIVLVVRISTLSFEPIPAVWRAPASVETFPPVDVAVAGAVGVLVSVEAPTPADEAIRDAGRIDGVEPPPVVGRSRGKDLSPEEEARRAANRAREMARNVQWTCGTCHRRTRQPECSNGHPPVAAPVGKRRGER